MHNPVLFLADITAVIFLIWLIWPSITYRVALKWLKKNQSQKCMNWINYLTVKRQVTVHFIAMNAIKNTEFSPDDLNQLNELFEKLGQEPAHAIAPAIGARFNESKMKDRIDDTRNSLRSRIYVLRLNSIGVEWKGEVLKKAEVEACNSDRLMIHKLGTVETAENQIAHDFLNYLGEANVNALNLELQPTVIKGFIDMRMCEEKADILFEILKRCHPESDFLLIYPKNNELYNADTMATHGGGLAGQNCRVVGVVHPGLIRTQHRDWRIKALVKIINL